MSKLPDTWQEVKLKDIATFSQGLQVGVEEQVSTPSDNYVRFIRIVDYTQKNEDIRFVENKGQRYFASKSDIVMVRYGTPGLVGRGIEGIIANNLFKINLDQKIANNDFFEHLLKSSFVQNKLQSGSASTTMPAINFSTLNTVVIPLPPLEEQKKIADILSTVDKKIAFVEENINATEELKKGLMQKLLTEGIGHTEFKDSELGRIPESWEVVTLNKYCNIFMSNVDKKSNSEEEKVLLCNYMDIYNNNYITNEISFMEATASSIQIEKFSLNVGDIMITKDSETKFDIARSSVVIENLQNVLCGYHLALIKPDKNKFNSIFLTKIFDLDLYRKQLINKANGTTRFGLNVSTIENFLIPFPPLEEQKQIAEILLTIDNKLENLKEKKQSFEELKKGLMQKLLTGEVRV